MSVSVGIISYLITSFLKKLKMIAISVQQAITESMILRGFSSEAEF
jgi:hypothetical protein